MTNEGEDGRFYLMIQRGLQLLLMQPFVSKECFTLLRQPVRRKVGQSRSSRKDVYVRLRQLHLLETFGEVLVLSLGAIFVLLPFDLRVQLSSQILLADVRRRGLYTFAEDE